MLPWQMLLLVCVNVAGVAFDMQMWQVLLLVCVNVAGVASDA